MCASLTPLATRTRVIVFSHYRDARKPTNTARLAPRLLTHATVGLVGEQVAMPMPAIPRSALLLYPADDAVPLVEVVGEDTGDEPPFLVVPDGNWRQAGKMRKRIEGLSSLRCVSLRSPCASVYGLRHEPKEGGLSTLEAIALALLHLEQERGPLVHAHLMAALHQLVQSTLLMRGTPLGSPASGLRDSQSPG